ncbi:MAG: hypothetical protein II337_00405 [Clostridia bacterium]|nr:hypothetical protein [Clostridia bacterium]
MKRILALTLIAVLCLGIVPAFSAKEEAAEVDLFAAATWNKGAFYHTETPNTGLAETRRYTTISCKEGDVFSFKFNSKNWNPYLYPADEKGSIDGNYVQVTDGMEYHVKAINGRVPTTLRITVCPSPDGVISDDMWAKFDVNCFRSDGKLPEIIKEYNEFDELKWKVGSYHDNALHEDKGMRYAVLPCHKNDVYTFEFNNNDFGLRIYYYDEKGELTDFETTTLTKTAEIRINAKNGKVPSELRITAYPIAGGEITDAMWEEKFDITCTKESDFITVATMNYGLWYDGGTKYVPDNKVEETLAKWKFMFDRHDPDIIGGQEWLKHFDRSNKIPVEEYLFGYKYAYQYVADMENFASKFPITQYEKHYHTNSTRYYTTGYVEINGKEIFLVNVHLGIEPDFNISRKAQYEDILNLLKDKEYFIMFGDFNAYTTSEFKVFKEAGYSVANGGAFGTFNTWTHFGTESSWKNQAIDNIVVSSNIKILKVKCDRRELSDHNMLIAELQILNGDEEENTSTDTSTDTSANTNTNTVTDEPSASTNTDPKTSNVILPIAVIAGVVVAAAAALCAFLFRKKSTASK